MKGLDQGTVSSVSRVREFDFYFKDRANWTGMKGEMMDLGIVEVNGPVAL